ETDRVALFVIGCVAAGGGGAGGSGAGVRSDAVHRAAARALVERIAARGGGRQAVGVEPREHRLHVQPLERRELGADDERVVLAAVRAVLGGSRAVTAGQL